MNILGEKIILRAITAGDCDLLLNLINDPATEKMLGGASFPVSPEGQAQWIANLGSRKDELRCVIARQEAPEIGLGTVILSHIDYKNGTAQIHIKMAQDIGRGKGYGTDAINTLVDYAFRELRLHCIYAEVLEYNLPSQKLFQKCGFELEGLLRARVYKDSQYIHVFSFSKVAQA